MASRGDLTEDIPLKDDLQDHSSGVSCGISTSLSSTESDIPPAAEAHSSSTTPTPGQDYLDWVKDLVNKNKHSCFKLNHPGCSHMVPTLKVGDLEDTIYKDDGDELYEWGNFYLAKAVEMQVVGVVEGSLLQCEQLVLMTCEDRKVYGFDGEELHLVAENLDSVAPSLTKGTKEKGEIKYPGFKTYYRGEAFKDKTKQDWAEVKKSDVGRRLDEEHCKLVAENKSELLKNLRIIKANLGVAK